MGSCSYLSGGGGVDNQMTVIGRMHNMFVVVGKISSERQGSFQWPPC